MGAVIVSAQLTLDGVMDQIEDWFIDTGTHEEHGLAQIMAADALVLGRETYEALAVAWARSQGVLADRINSMPKFVASRTLHGPLRWNAQLLDGPVEESVARLRDDTVLLSYGCGGLAHDLARAGLVDEFQFYVHPAVLGSGVRVFGGRRIGLEPISTTAFSSGVTLLTYRRAG
jgi:dihydrofolate reductase